MKDFDRGALDRVAALKELTQFRQLLAKRTGLSERDDVLPFFRRRPDLCRLVGLLHPRIFNPDRLAVEFDLFGDLACDLVVGDSRTGAYVFVEFEDAQPTSVFRKVGRFQLEWAPRFDHGFSQLIDWFYALDDARRTAAFAQKFGGTPIDFMGALVCGRAKFISAADALRLDWRQKSVVINSQKIRCLTFDGLHEDVSFKVAVYPLAAGSGPGRGAGRRSRK